MGFRRRLCRFVFCSVLAFASIGGAPMRPEEVEDLMRTMNQPKIAHSLRDETDDGEDLIKNLRHRPS